MKAKPKTKQELLVEVKELRRRLDEAEQALRAIRDLEADAVPLSKATEDLTEREPLRLDGESERRRLEAVMEALPVGVAITDTRGGNLRSNKAYEDLWGSPRPKAESVDDYEAYKAWWSDTGKPVAPEEWASAQAVQKGEVVVGQLMEIQRFDGSRASVINSGAPIFDRDGKITGCAVAIQDISDLRKAEHELRENEERLRRIIETSPVAIGFGDSTGRIFEANESFYRLTGYTREEIQSRQLGWDRLTAPEYVDLDRQIMAVLAATGSAGPYEKEYIRKDGSRVPLLLSVSKFPGRDEHVAFILDITERKREEQERERLRIEAENEKRRLEAVMEALPVGVAITDTRGGNLRSNKAYEDLWGSPRPKAESVDDYEAYKAWWSDTGKPVAPEEWASAQAVQKGRAVTGQLLEIERFDGSRASVINSGAPIFDADGKIAGCAVAVQDITPLRKAEQALRESESKYRSLFENMLNGIAYHQMLFDDHGKPVDYIYLEVNDAFEKMTGLKRENVVGRRVTELLPGVEHEQARWIEIYGKITLTGEPIRFENYSEALGKWYSVSAYSPGAPYFVTVFEDVTERRESEEKLRLSETKFRIVAHNTHDMEFWIDPVGRYLYASPSCKGITGYEAHEFMEDPDLRRRIVHPDDLPVFDIHLQRETEKEASQKEVDFRIIHRDGSIRWLGHVCKRVFDEKGRFQGIRGSNRDITERKQAESLSEALNAIALTINSTVDFEEIMSRAVTFACEALGAESCAVSLRQNEKWSVAHEHGFPQEIIGAEISDEEDPHASLAIKTMKVVVINDAFNDDRVNPERMKKFNIRSVMVIPLVTKYGSTGVIFVNYHSAPVTFTGPQIDFANKLGYLVSLAVENAGLLTAEKKAKDEFKLLSDTAGSLLSARKPQETVNDLCQKVMTHLDCHAFFNYLVDENLQRLHLNAYAGIPESTAREIEWLDYGVAVCGCAARDAARIVCENIPVTPDPRTELVNSFGIKAYACHPLFAEGQVIGTLSFGTCSRTAFTEAELSLMKTVADQVAIAMEGARLMEAVRRSRDELEMRVKERTADLARANELLEKVFSSVDICLAYMDPDFNFIRVNRAYAEVDEHEPDFYPGKNHFALFPNEENERIFKAVVNTFEPYSVYARPFEYAQHPERGVTYWDWNLQPVKDPDGSVGGLVLSLMNVTERVRTQEAVKAERQRFFDVLETLPAYVVLLTPDYHAAFANRVFRERFGESHGLRCFEFLFGLNEPCEGCETYTVLKTGAPHEWEWKGPDGRVYSVFDFPFRDTDGSSLILEMGIDITVQKQAQEELKEREREIRHFATQYLNAQEMERRRIAAELHDSIASALAGIKFRIEKTAEDMEKGLGKHESLRHLASNLAQSISEVRRIMADLRPSILDDLGILPALNWFCREFEATYSHLCVEKRIGISEEQVPDTLKIVIFRISQEAMNNIAKHSKASLVDLALHKAGGRVELTIRDNGHGFQPDEITKGFGLSTMRERAELTGGAFAVQSTKGKGTIIRASWPLTL